MGHLLFAMLWTLICYIVIQYSHMLLFHCSEVYCLYAIFSCDGMHTEALFFHVMVRILKCYHFMWRCAYPWYFFHIKIYIFACILLKKSSQVDLLSFCALTRCPFVFIFYSFMQNRLHCQGTLWCHKMLRPPSIQLP